ncbi:MAG TPA: ABC transporter substrate-binding protein [Micromonosporaceae bacterium]|jgi:iron complex transport system substrate-binding protein
MHPSPRRTVGALAALLVLALATACGSSARPNPQPTATGVTYPVTVGSVTLDHQPQRIVSLSPVMTEMLFAVGAGDQVVAVDSQSNYPADAPVTDLSAYTPNAEAVATYTPDLVVLSDDISDIVGQLTALHIPVYVGKAADTTDDTYRELAEIGTLTGHPGDASALVERMKDDLAKILQDVPARSKPLTYFYELDNTFYTATSESFIGRLFTAAGLVNIADAGNAGNGYPQISQETILAANPDLIFLADAYPGGESAQTVAARPGWANLKAVRTGQVVELDTDIASRWGPRIVDLQRAIVDAIVAVPSS